MNSDKFDDEMHALLSAYAMGTLTEAERARLFEKANSFRDAAAAEGAQGGARRPSERRAQSRNLGVDYRNAGPGFEPRT